MQRAIFVIEYALARWWMSVGLIPVAMVGHSVGEFVAATLAGVFSLPDGLQLVAKRGALMQAQPAGAMLAVRLSAQDVRARLPGDLSLAADNAPAACVVSGAHAAIARFQDELERDGIACRPLRTSHAFHSPMMEPVVAPFLAQVAATKLSAPVLPLVSTASGDWLDPATATSAEYWARHLRVPVRFSTALDRVLDSPSRVLLEVGPRGALSALAREHPAVREHGISAVPSLDDEPGSETASVRLAAGRLWSLGVALDTNVFDRRERRQRVRLPTYPFQRQRFWVDATIPEPGLAQPPARIAAPAEHAMRTLQAADAGPDEATDPRVRYLIDVWSEMLGGPVAADDNFFELGGHSMLAVQMVNRVDRETGVRIKLIRLGAENLAQIAATLPAPQTTAPPAPAGVGGRFGHRLKRLLGIVVSDPGP